MFLSDIAEGTLVVIGPTLSTLFVNVNAIAQCVRYINVYTVRCNVYNH